MSNSVLLTRRALALRLTQLSLLGAAGLGLSGCGFRLRGSQNFAFSRAALTPASTGAVATELRQALGARVQLLAPELPLTTAQVVVSVPAELREKTVVGVNTSGQVREFQLRIRLRFSVTTPLGKEIFPETEILQQRDISYNESAALAKEAEEALLYRDMQSDIAQQLMRRLAAIKPTQLD
jgi:LPS-assembly lipoprotein